MSFPVKIEMGGHVIYGPMHALPRVGDKLTCAFPASGIPELNLQVTGVSFQQTQAHEGREFTEPMPIVVTVDDDPEFKKSNDRKMRELLEPKPS